jgi:hypothetical protein
LLGDQIAARPKRAFHASPELLFSSQIGQKYYKNSVANAQRLNFLNSDRALRLLNGNGGQRDYLAVWLLCGLTAWMNRNQM